MVIDFSKIDYEEKPILILRNLDGTAIQTLGYAFNVKADLSYNEVSTLTFDLPETVDDVATPHYDDVVGMRIVDWYGIGQFILINPSEQSNGVTMVKSCKAYSLEYEFAKKDFYLEAGVFNFWNPLSPDDTIIGRILEKMPDWSIGYIDTALVGKYRTFEELSKKAYDFIKSDVQQSYGCIIDFNTYERKIYAVSVDSVVPIHQIYLSRERLIDDIKVEENSDEIVTCLDVNGDEGVNIRLVNPTGSNKLYNIDYFLNETNFSAELVAKWRKWEQDCEDNREAYFNLIMEYNLRRSQTLAEQVILTDLQGELGVLQSQQAVIIQAIAQKLQDQSALDEINEQILAKQGEIDAEQEYITELNAGANTVYTMIEQINAKLAMDRQEDGKYVYFTPEELTILQRYFIEDSFEDSSFALVSTASYDNVDSHVSLSDIQAVFTGGEVESVDSTGGNSKLWTMTGGSLQVGTLSATLVRATAEFGGGTKPIVLSAYLERGTIGEASFESGTLTLLADEGNWSITDDGCRLTITSGDLYFTKNSTDYEQYSVEWDLYEYGKSVLDEKAFPSYTFSVDSGNFLAADAFVKFKNELTLGERVYLNLSQDGTDKLMKPFVTQVHVEFEDFSNFSIEFSSTYSSSDAGFRLAQLLEKSVSLGKTLNTKSGMYAEFVNSGASTRVKSFMDSALDIAKNAVLSSGNQAITFDDTGIRIRKWKDKAAGTYEDEQIWMVDNVIAFTRDNWNTANMAIGKIFDENIIGYTKTSDAAQVAGKTYYTDADGTVWDGSTAWSTDLYELDHTAYGIVAPYLVGTILAGQNLIIDTENGAFRVDSNGVWIDSLKFYITHGDTEDTTLAEELQKLADQSDDIAQDLADAITQLSNDIINKTVTTYYQGASEGIPDAKAGDLWYVNGDEDFTVDGVTYRAGHLYRFNNSNTWDEITDANAIAAIAAAEDAQATADRKIATYYQDNAPSDPDHGDLWFNTNTGKLYRYNGNTATWQLVEDGDIDGLKDADAQIAENMARALEDIDGRLSKVTTTYYTATIPTNPNTGDLLYYTGDGTSRNGVTFTTGHLYRYNGSTWDEITDADALAAIRAAGEAQDTADEKILFHYQDYTTDGLPVTDEHSTGDIWYNTAQTDRDGYEAGKLYRFNGTSWVKVEDGDIAELKEDVNTINTTIGEFYSNGFLSSAKLSGVIDAQQTQMKSGTGNVLFDTDGIWLMNATTKSNATKAIWMNENGILFGTGSRSDDPGADGSGWTWTTAISHEGITAEALAGKTISGLKMYGGELYIGPSAYDSNGNVTDWNFVVDRNGNLTAKSGAFEGTVRAKDILRPNSGGGYSSIFTNAGKISGDYLDLLGITIYDGNGNVTMTIDGTNGVTLRNGAIQWDTGLSTDNIDGLATVATTGRYRDLSGKPDIPEVPEYIQSTYIDEVNVISPNIYGGEFYATGRGRYGEPAYYFYDGFRQLSNGNIRLGNELGYISYDDNGSGSDGNAAERLIFHASSGMAIKIESGGASGSSGGLSLDAGDDTIHAMSPLRLYDIFRISASSYGSSLPSSGVPGELFFVYS